MKFFTLLISLLFISKTFAEVNCRGEVYEGNKKLTAWLKKEMNGDQVVHLRKIKEFEFYAEERVPFVGVFLRISSDSEGVITEAYAPTLPVSLVGAAEKADVILDCQR